MTAPAPLTFRAGPGARKIIERNGLDPKLIRVVPGASGGAKWLILKELDQVIVPWLLADKDRAPIHLLGSSVGSWRFLMYAQDDPVQAFDRFRDAYVHHKTPMHLDRVGRLANWGEMLDAVVGPGGFEKALAHPVFRSNIMAVRSKHLAASEQTALLGLGLALAATGNMLTRKALGLFFERALFHDPRERPPFASASDLPISHTPLSARNLRAAVLATCSIPFVVSGVSDIPEAPAGVYRDGGITDYHFDLPWLGDTADDDPDGLIFYPHFQDRIIPGWFDKNLAWRNPGRHSTDRMVLVSPSREFVAALPDGRIPDRRDFTRLPDDVRLSRWETALSESRRMADDMLNALEKGQILARLESFQF